MRYSLTTERVTLFPDLFSVTATTLLDKPLCLRGCARVSDDGRTLPGHLATLGAVSVELRANNEYSRTMANLTPPTLTAQTIPVMES